MNICTGNYRSITLEWMTGMKNRKMETRLKGYCYCLMTLRSRLGCYYRSIAGKRNH